MEGSLSVGSAGSQSGHMGQGVSQDRSLTPGGKNNVSSNLVNESSGEVKPRSLRFTWSMKTTSSRDPNEIMAEIKKVRIETCRFWVSCTDGFFFWQVLDANNCDYEQRERFLLLCVHGDPNTDSLVQVRCKGYMYTTYFSRKRNTITILNNFSGKLRCANCLAWVWTVWGSKEYQVDIRINQLSNAFQRLLSGTSIGFKNIASKIANELQL